MTGASLCLDFFPSGWEINIHSVWAWAGARVVILKLHNAVRWVLVLLGKLHTQRGFDSVVCLHGDRTQMILVEVRVSTSRQEKH